MAYDEKLADRVRQILKSHRDVSEKKMFGGVAFLFKGKMFVGITKDDLMVRVGPERHAEALSQPHVRPMDFTGKPMKGYVYVGMKGCGEEKTARPWVERGLEFVATLPASKKKSRR